VAFHWSSERKGEKGSRGGGEGKGGNKGGERWAKSHESEISSPRRTKTSYRSTLGEQDHRAARRKKRQSLERREEGQGACSHSPEGGINPLYSTQVRSGIARVARGKGRGGGGGKRRIVPGKERRKQQRKESGSKRRPLLHQYAAPGRVVCRRSDCGTGGEGKGEVVKKKRKRLQRSERTKRELRALEILLRFGTKNVGPKVQQGSWKGRGGEGKILGKEGGGR